MGLRSTATILAASGPPGLLPAREQMAVSLGWHIVLACFGVAFPTMIFVMHRRGIVRDDPTALRLARRWAKVAGVLFAIGAVSGTVLSFEMGLVDRLSRSAAYSSSWRSPPSLCCRHSDI